MKYQIQDGDTLWGLAKWFYGDGRLHRVLAETNYLSNPDYLVVGQELEIPYVTFRHQVTAGDTTRKPGAALLQRRPDGSCHRGGQSRRAA